MIITAQLIFLIQYLWLYSLKLFVSRKLQSYSQKYLIALDLFSRNKLIVICIVMLSDVY